jgi:hypothetical protein
MSDLDVARSETLTRLAQSRAELLRLLVEPELEQAGDAAPGAGRSRRDFPRSRTMRALMTGRGIGTLGAMIGGLFMARPALALRLLRLIPAGMISRMLLGKALAAFRASGELRR